MTRAYAPRMSTVDLIAEILARPGVKSARVIPPIRSAWTTRPTRIRITLQSRFGSPIYDDFTLAEARAWLDAEYRYDDQASSRIESSACSGDR